MDRRNFLGELMMGSGIYFSSVLTSCSSTGNKIDVGKRVVIDTLSESFISDIIIVGAGVGGYASALSALKNGLTVVMTEETDWIGGQLTQQMVPPDEHPWIEEFGSTSSYRKLRNMVRDYYRSFYPLKEEELENKYLNPGKGSVSRLCSEPKVWLHVMENMLMPYISSGRLILLLEHKVVSAEMEKTKVKSLNVKNLKNGKEITLYAEYFVDATELGDLLPITGTEYVTGAESKNETNELHASEYKDPTNEQAFTMCFALDYMPGEDWTIRKPEEYDFWRNYVPDLKRKWSGNLLSLTYCNPQTLEPRTFDFHPEGKVFNNRMNWWNYRKIIDKNTFETGFYKGDISLINWPQNDYILGRIVDVSDEEFRYNIERAKQLSLSLVYWLQTEVERPDGGKGWKGLRLRNDISGTQDGLAKYPYVRESRRIKSVFTIKEEHVGKEQREMYLSKGEKLRSSDFYDSVGVGYYHIDLHPSTGGDNYIDFPSLRYEIPLGALIPVKTENLLPACKNIGTTHITNGCYRLHPTEWGIGEAVGTLVKYALDKKVRPRDIREDRTLLKGFQDMLCNQGVELKWPDE